MWLPNTSTLDLYPGHGIGQLRPSSEKVGVVISIAIGTLGYSLEAVQVELPLEGRILGLLKVLRHDQVDKVLLVVHDEATAVGLPRCDVLHPICTVPLEHLVKLYGERLGDSVGLAVNGAGSGRR